MTDYSDLLTPRVLNLANVFAGRHAPPGTYRYDELVADLYMSLLRAARTYDPARGVKFPSFAYLCLERACWRLVSPAPSRHDRDWLRLASLDAPGPDGERLAAIVPAREAPDPADLEILELLLSRVPPVQRAAFVMRTAYGEGWPQIAERLGLSVERAKTAVRRAGKRLSECAEKVGRRHARNNLDGHRPPPGEAARLGASRFCKDRARARYAQGDIPTARRYVYVIGPQTVTGPAKTFREAMGWLGLRSPETRGGDRSTRDALALCNEILDHERPGTRLARGPDARDLVLRGRRFVHRSELGDDQHQKGAA